MVLVLNMWDLAKKEGIQIDLNKIQECFPDITIIHTNARVGIGKDRIIDAIKNHKKEQTQVSLKVMKHRKKQKRITNNKIAAFRKKKIQELTPKFVEKERTKKQVNSIYYLCILFGGYLFFYWY